MKRPIKLNFTKKQLDNNEGSGGLEIKIKGCRGDPLDTRPGTALFLEYYEGKVQLHVWTNAQQDCQTIILN
jgi:hypothetical protein